MTPRTRAILLVALGFLNLAGIALQSPKLSGLAMATAASPAPSVFTTVDGLETFSSTFTVEWSDEAGEHSLLVEPSAYRGIEGPYNRRNMYGAVLAYGPVLRTRETTREMFDDVAAYAICGDAPILRELGINPETARDVRVVVAPREGSRPALPLTMEAQCSH